MYEIFIKIDLNKLDTIKVVMIPIKYPEYKISQCQDHIKSFLTNYYCSQLHKFNDDGFKFDKMLPTWLAAKQYQVAKSKTITKMNAEITFFSLFLHFHFSGP